MEKLGQLRRDAQRLRALGPDRGGHPAVPLGAGLPRRPGAALQLPRRPVHPDHAGAGQGPGPADDRRVGGGHQRAHQDPRRAGAPGPVHVRGGVRHPLRRLPAARARRPSSCCRRRSTAFLVVAAPEPDALREAAYFVERLGEEQMPLAGLVVNRAHPGSRGSPAEQATAAAERLADGAGRRPHPTGSPPGCCALAADRDPRRRPGSRGCADASPPRTRTCPPRSSRRSRPTCTTSTACG